MGAREVEIIENAYQNKLSQVDIVNVYVEGDEDDDLVTVTFDDFYATGGIIDDDIKRIESRTSLKK